jgi:hypothetical protein
MAYAHIYFEDDFGNVGSKEISCTTCHLQMNMISSNRSN